MDTHTFEELGLSATTLSAVNKLGFESPSSIQALTIPVALEGHDIVGLSQTGSGKTAAFTLPCLEKINIRNVRPQVLIMCPTRELCVQVCEEVHRLGSGLKDLQAIPVYGGAPIDRQIRSLKRGVHIVVGTPGRLLDHIKRKTVKLDNIATCILDEADRMLDMGFREDMEKILSETPEERQTLFFSATMNRAVEKLIETFSNEPKHIKVKQKALTVSTIEQSYFEVRNRSKIEVVSRLLDLEPPRLAIVFCNTKRAVDECCEALLARGYSADRIHGDITQANRERVLKRFRDGSVELLVATDVAARGLDIDDIDAVFNYDLPQDPEDYVHRIGRTGRAGRSGYAYSFIYGRDIYRLQSLERYTKQVVKRAKVPTRETMEGQITNKIYETLKERLEAKDYKNHEDHIDRLLDQGHTPTDIASALLSMIRDGKGRDSKFIAEDNESQDFEDKPRKLEGDPGSHKKRKRRFNSSSKKNYSKGSGGKGKRSFGGKSGPKKDGAKPKRRRNND